MVDNQIFNLGVKCSDGSNQHEMVYKGSDQQESWQGDSDKKNVKRWFCPGCGMNKYTTAS